MFSRSGWKPVAVLTVALSVVVAAGLWVRQGQKRAEFLGNVDPASGYRCRFTLSSNWHRHEDRSGRASDVVDFYRFTPPEIGPILRWIETHIPHRSKPTQLPPFIAPEIYLITNHVRQSSDIAPLLNGYPIVPRLGEPLTERHITIDSCPATIVEDALTDTVPPIRTATLLVYTPDRKVVYSVNAFFLVPENQGDREIQAIIASFHIEKVAVPPFGKR